MPLPSRAARGRRAPMAEINVTPLVDVMLVLLIIFMVTAPLLTAGVPVELPDSRARPLQQDRRPVLVSIDRTGRVFVDQRPVDGDALGTTFALLAERSAAPPQIFLRADRGLDFARVMRVMGELNHAGLNRVALVTVADSRQ